MTMSPARGTFFFDIGNFPAGGNLAVAANDASAAESGETEKSYETHRVLHSRAQQYTCRLALAYRTPAAYSGGVLRRRTPAAYSGGVLRRRTPAPYSGTVLRHRTLAPRDRRFFESLFGSLESVARREEGACLGHPASRGGGGGIDRQRLREVMGGGLRIRRLQVELTEVHVRGRVARIRLQGR